MSGSDTAQIPRCVALGRAARVVPISVLLSFSAHRMSTPSAQAAGTFTLGGDLPIHRMGYGAMRITGKGIWGPPADRDEALRVLRRAVELGVDFIDTADSYGPFVSEDLIAEALHPYPDGLVVATKGGLVRTGPQQWHEVGRPAYLRQCVEMSLRRLKLEHDPALPAPPHRPRGAAPRTSSAC